MKSETSGHEQPARIARNEIEGCLQTALEACVRPGERVLCLVPDGTRTMDLPFFFRRIATGLRERAARLDFMVALGTHPPLAREELDALFGLGPGELEASFPGLRIFNHRWNEPGALSSVGTITAAEMEELSGGELSFDLPVRVDERALDCDRILICGPVFPHEVAGFSGGNKYLFPGISGPELIDATHWLGALEGTFSVIGRRDTAVRRAIDLAASRMPVPRSAICPVCDEEGIFGIFSGEVEKAWAEAAELAGRTHVTYLERPVARAVAVLPEMYRELWVGAKGMYKLDPVVADGGEVVIYAPKLDRLSRTHGGLIRELGYHVLPYYARQWERFSRYPWTVLAHSTHLRGRGGYDPATGVESPRIRVTLATALPETLCRELGLGWLDPDSAEMRALARGEEAETLVVRRAGERLYRLSTRYEAL
jgi:nickel-dependent lactate racemase